MIVLLSVLVDCAVVLSPDVFALFVATQLKVEAIFAVNGMLTVLPLQIVEELALVIVGRALTVTVNVRNTLVAHPLETDNVPV